MSLTLNQRINIRGRLYIKGLAGLMRLKTYQDFDFFWWKSYGTPLVHYLQNDPKPWRKLCNSSSLA